jgi:hypothetical protein
MGGSYTQWVGAALRSFLRRANSAQALVGFVSILLAIGLICWGEQKSVEYFKSNGDGESIIREISSDYIDAQNDLRLVHISGVATAEDILEDAEFGVIASALKLKRIVEVYQWNEIRNEEAKNLYAYQKFWSEKINDSDRFQEPNGHENPLEIPFNTAQLEAESVSVGDFVLAEDFKGMIQNYSEYKLSKEDWMVMEDDLKKIFTVYGAKYYSGDPKAPSIGDVRVSFKIIRPFDVSIIGMQNKDEIVVYSKNNSKIAILNEGMLSADEMLNVAEDISAKKWVSRIGAILLLWIGLVPVLNRLSMLYNFSYIRWNRVTLVLSSLIIAVVIQLALFSIIWISFRPFLSLASMAFSLALGGISYIAFKRKLALKSAEGS